MKKIILLFAILLTGLVNAQTPTGTTSAGKFKMYTPALGTLNDSCVVWNGTTKELKYVKISDIIGNSEQNFQEVLDAGGESYPYGVAYSPDENSNIEFSLIDGSGSAAFNFQNLDNSKRSGFNVQPTSFSLSSFSDNTDSNCDLTAVEGEFSLTRTKPSTTDFTNVKLREPVSSSFIMIPTPLDDGSYNFGIKVNDVEFDANGKAEIGLPDITAFNNNTPDAMYSQDEIGVYRVSDTDSFVTMSTEANTGVLSIGKADANKVTVKANNISANRDLEMPNNNGVITVTGSINGGTKINADSTGNIDFTIPGAAGTNLTTSQTSTSVTINSDTGTDAAIPLGNGTNAGVSLNNYDATDKAKVALIGSPQSTNGVNFYDGTNITSNANTLFWDSNRFRIQNTGTSAASPQTGTLLHLVSQSNTFNGRFSLDSYIQTQIQGSVIQTRTARGTVASPTASQTDDIIGAFNGVGYKFTTFGTGGNASMTFRAGSNMTDTNAETYMTFSTTPNASTTLTERFRIGSAGQFGIGGANFGTSGQIFTSGGASAVPTWSTSLANGITATTQTQGDNSTKVATTAYVDAGLAEKVTDNAIVDYSASSTIVGWSSFTTKSIKYLVQGKVTHVWFYIEGTSNTTSVSFTIPTNHTGTKSYQSGGWAYNNSAGLNTAPRIEISNGSNVVTLSRLMSNTGTPGEGWTASATKGVSGYFTYEN